MEAREAAEEVALYVTGHVRRRAGSRFLQGARKERLSHSQGLGPSLDLLSTSRVRGLSEPVVQGLLAWGRGERRVHLLREVPTPRDVLAWQALGERCVSLLPDDAVTAPHEDGLAFALHDLCHLEKLADGEHYLGQVGFFSSFCRATTGSDWDAFMGRFDTLFAKEIEHVSADMNGSAIFLFAALKMKLKMAVRRKVGRDLGRPPRESGPLEEEEAAAFAREEDALMELLGIEGEIATACRCVSTRKDAPEAATLVLAHFEAVGRASLAAR